MFTGTIEEDIFEEECFSAGEYDVFSEISCPVVEEVSINLRDREQHDDRVGRALSTQRKRHRVRRALS